MMTKNYFILFLFFSIFHLNIYAEDKAAANAETNNEISKSPFHWGFKELGDELASPVTTDAKYALGIGTVLTLGSILLWKDLSNNIDQYFFSKQPLGSSSKWGDYAGRSIPNALYVLGQTFVGLSGNQKGYVRALNMLKATVYSGAITHLLKHTIRSRRPSYDSKDSFPSGHTTVAFAFGGQILVEHGPLWGVPALALSCFSGLSRINDRKHHFRDVLAGATIGLSYGIGLALLNKSSDFEKLEMKTQNDKGENHQSHFLEKIFPVWERDIQGIFFVSRF